MSQQDYDALQTAAEEVFKSLYILDAGSMSAADRQKHQQALSAAYLAVVRLENNAFTELTAAAAAKIPTLATKTAELQQLLVGLKNATEVISIVSGALDVLGSIAKLLK